MMQVIDDDYVAALLDLPDGRERVTRWIFSLLNERDDAQVITKACVEKLKGGIDFLEIEDTPEEAAQLLAWFDQRHDLMLVNQDGVWGVFQGGGSIVVASEDTAIEALREAHKVFCDGR